MGRVCICGRIGCEMIFGIGELHRVIGEGLLHSLWFLVMSQGLIGPTHRRLTVIPFLSSRIQHETLHMPSSQVFIKNIYICLNIGLMLSHRNKSGRMV